APCCLTASTIASSTKPVMALDVGAGWGLRRLRVQWRPNPGRIPRVPPSAERFVELDKIGQAREPRLCERVLRREELLLGIEHFDIAREPGDVSDAGDTNGLLIGRDRSRLRRLDPGE